MLLSGLCFAHPGYGGVRPSHRVDLTLEPERVVAVTSTRIPLHDVLAELDPGELGFDEGAGDAWAQTQLDGLRSFLALRADGERVPWELQGDATALTDERYVYYEQTLVAPVPRAAMVVSLENGNTPDVMCFFWVDLVVDPSWVVIDSSLFQHDDQGELAAVLAGQWRMEESMREVSFRVRPATGWEQWRREPEPLGIREASAPKLSPGWGVGAVLVVVAGLAFAASRASKVA